MESSEQVSAILDNFRQKQSKYRIEEFVLDFIEIWFKIHDDAKNYSLEEALTFSNKLFKSEIEPFFQKFKDQSDLNLYEGWVKNYSSIVISWAKRGHILFPLNLVVYEICVHKKKLFDFFLEKLYSGEIPGTKAELYKFLFPVLINFTIPLNDLDIMLLKTYQYLEEQRPTFYKDPTHQDFASEVDVSVRTVIRRMTVLRLLQMVQPLYFLDMGKLGYETTLFIHSDPVPKAFEKYLLFSVNLVLGNFSLIQMPYKNAKLMLALQDQLDILLSTNMKRRTSSWNLTGLSTGEEIWTNPPSFLFSSPDISLITPSPRMDFSLEPAFDPFRSLTPADFKILDFLTTTGTFRTVKHLSQSIKISYPQITQRLQEYEQARLILKTNQFFNIGLDLTISFFISTEDTKIPWLQHFLTFPKVDVFSCQDKDTPNYYFGYLKLPNKWIKPFSRQVDLVRNEYGAKFYYKIMSPFDHFKPALSLSDTYS